MTRRTTALALAMSLALAVLMHPGLGAAQTCNARPTPAPGTAGKPNVLIVVGDDWGWPYYGFMIERLRQLSRDGVLGKDDGQGFCPGAPSTCFCPGNPADCDDAQPCPDPDMICNETDCPAPGAAYDAPCQLHLPTPNLDRLAMEGVAFENGYAAEAACQPAHESLFTGLNQRDLALWNTAGCDYDGQAQARVHGPQTIPEALGKPCTAPSFAPDGGYNTFLAGRWWMGPEPQSFTDPESTNDATVGEQKSLGVLKEFIAEQDATVRPWLAVWTPLMPHYSYFVPDHISGDYDGQEMKNPPHISNIFSPGATRDNFESITYFDERVGELLEFLELLESQSCDLGPDLQATVHRPEDSAVTNGLPLDVDDDRIKKDVRCRADGSEPCPNPACDPVDTPQEYSSCIPDPLWDPYDLPSSGSGETSSEKCLGAQTQQTARYQGFRTNTLILFIMDNGAGIQNSKAHFSENGLRTPIIANYPREIPPFGLHQALVGSIDIFPTILQAVGAPERPFPDSRSFLPIIQDPSAEHDWRRYYFSNAVTDQSGQISVIDSAPAAPALPQSGLSAEFEACSPMKLYTDGFVKREASVKRLTHLGADPFEELAPAEPPLLRNARYPSGTSPAGQLVEIHLQDKLCEWDSCINGIASEREALKSWLGRYACGEIPPQPSPTPPVRCRACADEGGCAANIVDWTSDCDPEPTPTPIPSPTYCPTP